MKPNEPPYIKYTEPGQMTERSAIEVRVRRAHRSQRAVFSHQKPPSDSPRPLLLSQFDQEDDDVSSIFNIIVSTIVLDTPQQLKQVVRGLTEGSNGVSLVGFTNGFEIPKMNGAGYLEALLSVTFFGEDGSQKKHIGTVRVEISGLKKADMGFDPEMETKFRCLDSTTGIRILAGVC